SPNGLQAAPFQSAAKTPVPPTFASLQATIGLPAASRTSGARATELEPDAPIGGIEVFQVVPSHAATWTAVRVDAANSVKATTGWSSASRTREYPGAVSVASGRISSASQPWPFRVATRRRSPHPLLVGTHSVKPKIGCDAAVTANAGWVCVVAAGNRIQSGTVHDHVPGSVSSLPARSVIDDKIATENDAGRESVVRSLMAIATVILSAFTVSVVGTTAPAVDSEAIEETADGRTTGSEKAIVMGDRNRTSAAPGRGVRTAVGG